MVDKIKELKILGQNILTTTSGDLKTLIESQGQVALAELKNASEVASKHGIVILKKLSEITTDIASGSISVEDGEAAIASLWLGLDNLKHSITNSAKLQAFNRGRQLLAATQRIAVGIVSTSLAMAVPIAGNLVSQGLNQLTKNL